MGLPHSKTSQSEWDARKRASVMECGSPMPLFYVVVCGIGLLNDGNVPFSTNEFTRSSG
jgi:hypothetical protein